MLSALAELPRSITVESGSVRTTNPASGADGKTLDVFRSDNSFPNRKFVPSAAWYDTKTGVGVATFLKDAKGKKAPMRYLWDRRSYRKDYLCDYYHAEFPAGRVVVWEAVTGFFHQTDNNRWTDDAEILLKKLAVPRD